jgi:hypothetical protein
MRHRTQSNKNATPMIFSGDFLRKGARTPLRELFVVGGANCEICTNHEALLDVARESFLPISETGHPVDFTIRCWVDMEGKDQPPWSKPYFRGLGHIIYGGFGPQSSVLVDLLSRRIVGRFSRALASDATYWKTIIFPRLLTAIGPSIGITELHCGCAVLNDWGLLLAGGGGAGKSTLTLALAQNGLSILSEDWTYFSRRHSRVRAWGLPTTVKLLPDAIQHFPELKDFETSISLNGERVYQVDPVLHLGAARSRCCEPRWLVFLQRGPSPEFVLTRMSVGEAEARLRGDLLAGSAEVQSLQTEIVKDLVHLECWLLRYGGPAQSVARSLATFCKTQVEQVAIVAEGSYAG